MNDGMNLKFEEWCERRFPMCTSIEYDMLMEAWNAALEAAVDSLDDMSAYDSGAEKSFVRMLKAK